MMITCGVTFDEKKLKEKENFVLWANSYEPVTNLSIRRVRRRIAGASNHPVVQIRYILPTICV